VPRRASTRTVHALVVGLLIAGVVSYAVGLALWQGITIAAIAGGLLIGDQAFHRFRSSRDQRRRTQLSFQEERRCKGCNGDLWGLDVLQAKGGRYRVKCPECGVMTEFKPGKIRTSPKPSKNQWEEADTRSFKIR
jgi:hypothetical protein